MSDETGAPKVVDSPIGLDSKLDAPTTSTQPRATESEKHPRLRYLFSIARRNSG